MDENYALEMSGITKIFPGVKALDNVSFKVRPGSVHALMGENGAGKSTLMKCLFGIYKADSGVVRLHGKECHFVGTKDALEAGVSMIQQELSIVPERTVSQNLWLGREPLNKYHLIDHARMIQDTKDALHKVEFDFNPNIRMSSLSISQQQGCEIARAVSYNATIVVMDEPTSSLTENEVEHLFKIIRMLKSQNVAIVYISHKLEEIFDIADTVSVMRDGQMIGTYDVKAITNNQLISLMVGRETTQRFPPVENNPGDVCLEVKGLTSPNPRSFKNVDFSLHKGEILGVGGLVGAQRTELMEAVFGVRKFCSGTVAINGKEYHSLTPEQAISAGVGMITEDRRGSGIIPLMSVTDNTTIASLKHYENKIRLLEHAKLEKVAKKYNNELNTRTPSMRTALMNLSGGNQQKVIVSRWLMTLPDILIMDEPTRGIDVGAKYEIYTIMARLVKQGKAIIMVSSEMPELIGMCKRVMVMCAGRHTGTLEGTEVTQENIMRLATKFSE
ncbi:MAG: sugar ABC transporter ATP-binding protein [Sphaerochaetaceae bacterium]